MATAGRKILQKLRVRDAELNGTTAAAATPTAPTATAQKDKKKGWAVDATAQQTQDFIASATSVVIAVPVVTPAPVEVRCHLAA